MREIRLHGRGGQGAVVAAEILVNAIVMEGRFGSAIPFFGFERRGAPIVSFVRFDDQPVREKTQIYSPDSVIVMDPTLRNAVDAFAGLSGDGIAVLNERRSHELLGLPPAVKKVGIVDATHIAVELLGVPITNTAMLGAFAAATGWVGLQSIVESVRRAFADRPLVDENVQAAKTGYELTQITILEGLHR
jgi:2-oxoisovalerate ferredoxin oxidoreductase gamma subunit